MYALIGYLSAALAFIVIILGIVKMNARAERKVGRSEVKDEQAKQNAEAEKRADEERSKGLPSVRTILDRLRARRAKRLQP